MNRKKISSFCSENKETILYIVIGSIIGIIFLFAFSWTIDGQRKRNKAIESSGTECAKFPENTTFVQLQKILTKQWHWRYNMDIEYTEDNTQMNIGGYVEQRCPTAQHDVDVKINGNGVGRTDGKIVSAVSEISVEDCHNVFIGTIRTGNLGETIINGNNIVTMLQYRDIVGDIKYYILGINFLITHFNIYNYDGNVVAEIEQFKLKDAAKFQGWTWDIRIKDPTVDPLLLVSIAAKFSFSEKTSEGEDQTDICNELWNWMFIIMFVFVGIIIIFGCYIAYVIGKYCYHKSPISSKDLEFQPDLEFHHEKVFDTSDVKSLNSTSSSEESNYYYSYS